MKKLLLPIVAGLILISSASAQTATDLNEGARLVHDSSNTLQPFSFKFWGRSGYLYYVEQTEDLTTSWDYFELAILGNDAAESIDFNSTSDARFFRLLFSNDPFSELFTGSFDGDPLSNFEQVLLGMNPFVDEGPLNLTGDEDSDGVLNEFDAAPYRSSVGILDIAITVPADGSAVN